MTGPGSPGDSRSALAGYDGSPPAASAIETGARLLPHLDARIVHLWSPPFPSPELRRSLMRRADSLDDLSALLEREGAAEAERIVAEGVALARAAGWTPDALTHRSYGGEGLELARLAEQLRPAVVAVGSRGLSGVRAVLGSVSDMVVHYSPAPVLVVPHPLLSEEREATESGPLLVGHDGSEPARRALATAASLFEGRQLIAATVNDGGRGEGAAEPAVGEWILLDSRGRGGSARAIADALATFAAERGCALIVVGSRGRSPAREILVGSVAMATLHHAQRPVLVVPGGDRLRPGGNSAPGG